MILLLWILIQIIGESLPISSSGHVELMQRLASFSFADSWIIDFLLHGPTTIILLVYFFSIWWKLVFGQKLQLDYFFQKIVRPLSFIIIADIITFMFWMLHLSKVSLIASYFLPIGFCITAFCLYASRYGNFNKPVTWSLTDAIILGIAQGVSLLPGISRFACTYATGVCLGYDRKDSFALSFLIQIPLLCAAFSKGIFVVMHGTIILQNFISPLIIFTLVTAGLISYILFCLVGRLIDQNRLWYFAFYMIVPIVLSLLIVKDVVV